MIPTVAPFKVPGSMRLHRRHTYKVRPGVWEDILEQARTGTSPEGPGGLVCTMVVQWGKGRCRPFSCVGEGQVQASPKLTN